MLFGLLDGRARTSTELALIAGVSPSTASVHLSRLKAVRLVNVLAQGKYRYFGLAGADVAAILEALSVLTAGPRHTFEPSTPVDLRFARTCYDHIAGTLGVSLHYRFLSLGWLKAKRPSNSYEYDLTPSGTKSFVALGMDLEAFCALRRRFAFACLDWSERRFHLGGALGAAFLAVALKRRWVIRNLNNRVLTVTQLGQREMPTQFGVKLLAAHTS